MSDKTTTGQARLQSARDQVLSELDLQRFVDAGVDPEVILDRILTALIEVTDEVEAVDLRITDRDKPQRSIWICTGQQITEWLEGLIRDV